MILEKILADCRRELDKRKIILPLEVMEKMATQQTPPLDFAAALRGNGIRIIAEVKQASPSKGIICPDYSPAQIARSYMNHGASAISVLTETKHFMGNLNHLSVVRNLLGNKVPLLRKDFIFDRYQIFESRAYSADAILLIAAILEEKQLGEYLQLSHQLDMRCLVEVHCEAELEVALKSGAGIIGINNRDLQTFTVDIATTARLRPLIPPDRIVVSESGIKTRNDMLKMKQWKVDAVLIGEALLSAPDIGIKMKEMLSTN